VTVALGVLLAGASGCASVDRDDLRAQMSHLESATSEGILLTREAKQRRAPTMYVWEHSAELHHEAEGVIERLEGGLHEPEMRGPTQQGIVLARQVFVELGRLHKKANDKQAATVLLPKLEYLKEQVSNLRESL
jgi:hypothetical protein